MNEMELIRQRKPQVAPPSRMASDTALARLDQAIAAAKARPRRKWRRGTMLLAAALLIGAGAAVATHLPGQGEDVPGQIGVTNKTPEEAVAAISAELDETRSKAAQARAEAKDPPPDTTAVAARDLARFYEERAERLQADLDQLCLQLAEDGVSVEGCPALP